MLVVGRVDGWLDKGRVVVDLSYDEMVEGCLCLFVCMYERCENHLLMVLDEER